MRPHRAHDFGLFRPAAAVSESQDGSVTTTAGLFTSAQGQYLAVCRRRRHLSSADRQFLDRRRHKTPICRRQWSKNWPYNDANAAQHRHIAISWPTADAGLMPRHSASVERQPLAQRRHHEPATREKNNIPSTYCRLVQNVLSRSAKSPTEPLP